MKQFLFITFCLITVRISHGHAQAVHQYLVREAYNVIRTQIGYDIPVLMDHIGNHEIGITHFNPGGLLVIGAFREDEEDIVFNYGGPFGWNVSSTHFWEPDDGDGSKFQNSIGEVFENAYYKASMLLYGGYELRVPYPGGIVEVYEAPPDLAQYYKDGIIYYKGFYNSLGQYTARNYWDNSSQEFRDKIVWEILGRVCHLLGDMSVPAHVHNDEHTGGFLGWPIPSGYDYYESMMYNFSNYTNWGYQDAINAGGFLNVNNLINPLKQLFYTTVQITDFFPSDNEGGDAGWDLNDPFSGYPYLQNIMNSMVTAIGSPPSNVNLSQISDWAFTTGIRAIAGLLYWFATEAEIIPEFTVSPSTRNVGTLQGLSNITGSFNVTNTGAGSLSGYVKTTNPYYDLDSATPSIYEDKINFFLSEGETEAINYRGLVPKYAGTFVETFDVVCNQLPNKTYQIFGNIAIPDFCYPDERGLSKASPEESAFDNAFKNYYANTKESTGATPGSGKSAETITTAQKSLKERLDFAYRLLKLEADIPIETVCKMMIDLYPETNTRREFYVLDLLWEASLSEEAPNFDFNDFVDYLDDLTEKKNKYNINGYAELILGLLNIDKEEIRFDKILNDYKQHDYKEMSLFLKFIHNYTYKSDKDKARKISEKLDKKYPESKYGYQAHLIMGDEGYTLKGLEELIRANNKKLPKTYNSGENVNLSKPNDFALYKNYPNPFNPSTTIKYQIPVNEYVKVNIYNSMGQLIKNLVNEHQTPGICSVTWNGKNNSGNLVSSGIYFYKLETSTRIFTEKMILVK